MAQASRTGGSAAIRDHPEPSLIEPEPLRGAAAERDADDRRARRVGVFADDPHRRRKPSRGRDVMQALVRVSERRLVRAPREIAQRESKPNCAVA
jgi:hypothetical protein